MIETFLPIKGYENYLISNMGNVINSVNGKVISQHITNGYYQVRLFKNGKVKHLTVHRLVAEAFIPNPNNLKTVDHISGKRTDNRVSNLQWLSQSDNSKKFWKEQITEEQRAKYNEMRIKGQQGAKKSCSIPIICIETGKVYPSTQEASRELNIQHSNITATLKKRLKHTGGLHFEYYKGV